MRAMMLTLVLLFAHGVGALQNQLGDHPSPYLAMHGQDPVAWQDWSRETVELARSEGKLLLISSGYFSCHWCHVMQRESYQNPDIAAFLNRHFVPVKVDRELHGALDAHLVAFLEKTRGRAGWPLNIFLTPEGYPLIGVTYLPPDQFAEMLKRLQATWTEEQSRTRNLARRVMLRLMLAEHQADVEALGTGGAVRCASPEHNGARRHARRWFRRTESVSDGAPTAGVA